MQYIVCLSTLLYVYFSLMDKFLNPFRIIDTCNEKSQDFTSCVIILLSSAMANQEKPMPMKSTPVGPVAGGIMGCFLVLALGVYCYRHHIHRSSHQYINNLPENQNRMSHFYEEEPPEPTDDIAAGNQL